MSLTCVICCVQLQGLDVTCIAEQLNSLASQKYKLVPCMGTQQSVRTSGKLSTGCEVWQILRGNLANIVLG